MISSCDMQKQRRLTSWMCSDWGGGSGHGAMFCPGHLRRGARARNWRLGARWGLMAAMVKGLWVAGMLCLVAACDASRSDPKAEVSRPAGQGAGSGTGNRGETAWSGTTREGAASGQPVRAGQKQAGVAAAGGVEDPPERPGGEGVRTNVETTKKRSEPDAEELMTGQCDAGDHGAGDRDGSPQRDGGPQSNMNDRALSTAEGGEGSVQGVKTASMLRPVPGSDEAWRARLDPERYEVLRKSGTERAFTGRYWNHKGDGKYLCGGCGALLFDSHAKYDSGSGWPSFTAPLAEGAVKKKVDRSYGMRRTEVVCARCGSHLGHVFDDGPKPSGERFCINSASLDFAERDGKP